MKVLLEAKTNPDNNRSCNIKGVWIEVTSKQEASQRCREFIELNDLGAGNWTGGQIKDDKDNPIGHISYNGRIWPQKRHNYHYEVYTKNPTTGEGGWDIKTGWVSALSLEQATQKIESRIINFDCFIQCYAANMNKSDELTIL